jgi:hypothetical protein
MEYRNLDWAAVAEDEELDDEVQYVDIVALSETGDFQPIDCPSKVQRRRKMSPLPFLLVPEKRREIIL